MKELRPRVAGRHPPDPALQIADGIGQRRFERDLAGPTTQPVVRIANGSMQASGRLLDAAEQPEQLIVNGSRHELPRLRACIMRSSNDVASTTRRAGSTSRRIRVDQDAAR